MRLRVVYLVLVLVFVLIGVFCLCASEKRAFFNDTDASGKTIPVLLVSNVTNNPGSTSNWRSSIQAKPGDTVSFNITYRNGSNVVARNTNISLSVQPSASGYSVSGRVTAANSSNSLNGSVAILVNNLNGDTLKNLELIRSTWYPGGTGLGKGVGNPVGGVSIGDIAPQPSQDSLGYMVAVYRVPK